MDENEFSVIFKDVTEIRLISETVSSIRKTMKNERKKKRIELNCKYKKQNLISIMIYLDTSFKVNISI